uniref:arylamine N-acetyltransferase n=2 Tax=Nothobranchius rachovii TaxID=451742 RepID=A0A1A8NUM6_9TELE
MRGTMNLEEYFQRIGFHGPKDTADLNTLRSIHKLHVMSIPFENLSLHCGERITMDLEEIFNKIVRRSRGGWCFESNSLFGWVMRQMGFDATMLGSRVFNNGDFGSRDDHLIHMVRIGEKAYIADVGFGVSFQLWEPIELISGKDQPQVAGVFHLTEKDGTWILEKTRRKPKILDSAFAESSLVSKKETQQLYCFTLTPQEPEHFSEKNHSLQTDPASLFTNKSICSLQTPTGFRVLVGWTYSEVTYKPEEGIDVLDIKNVNDDEIEELLKNQFDVRLQNKLKPVNKKADYNI